MYQKKNKVKKTIFVAVRLTPEEHLILKSINKVTSKAIHQLIEDIKNNN